MHESSSDAELILYVQDGNDEALQELVRRYIQAVYTFCVRYTGNPDDAQDVTQETFLKAWRSIDRFDTNKSFRTWIFAIARNTANDLMRKRKSVPFSFFDKEDADTSVVDTIADEEPLPDELFADAARADEVRAAIQQLKSRDQLIISMRYEDELSFEDIAKILNVPAATIRSLHRRALVALRPFLTEPGFDKQ